MKLKNKKPYIDYLIAKLHKGFIIEVSDKELVIKRKRKWYQLDKTYKAYEYEEGKSLSEGVVGYLLRMLCEVENIDVFTYEEWVNEYFSNEIELY